MIRKSFVYSYVKIQKRFQIGIFNSEIFGCFLLRKYGIFYKIAFNYVLTDVHLLYMNISSSLN